MDTLLEMSNILEIVFGMCVHFGKAMDNVCMLLDGANRAPLRLPRGSVENPGLSGVGDVAHV